MFARSNVEEWNQIERFHSEPGWLHLRQRRRRLDASRYLSGTQAMEIIKDSLLEISEVSANTRISAQNKRKKQRKTQIYHLVENQYNLVFWARVVQFMSLERCKSVQNL